MNEGPSLLEPAEEPLANSADPAKRWTWERFGPLASKVALELFIVFIGVSAAFAVDDYRERRQEQQRREAIYGALDHELGQVAETFGPYYQRQMATQLDAWDTAVARGERPLPPTFKLPGAMGPPTGVWDAAAATGSIELVDPKFFYELGRYYNRARTAGELYRGYAESARVHVWPFLSDGPDAFWQPDGKLKPEIRVHLQRLRDFSDRQRSLMEEARELRAKLKQSTATD